MKTRVFDRSLGKQRGAAAIEFAVVFVFFFAIFYGIVSYSLPMLMMQSFNNAAAEAARQAVALVPGEADYQANSQTVVNDALGWMSATAFARVITTASGPDSDSIFSVTVSYPYKDHPLVPFLSLPGVGQIPRVPDNLTATASIKLSE